MIKKRCYSKMKTATVDVVAAGVFTGSSSVLPPATAAATT
jgi:hypothetical protein